MAGFILLNKAGHAAADALHLPVPGNLIGMLFLLALLMSGAIRLEWVHAAASILTRHLAFFFIPIAVGLMAFGPLFMSSGLAILVTLVVSAAIGICASACSSQLLIRNQKKDPG
ncbi:MAG: CidA/LrgA family protein [Betaproteobacteria bacterium]